MNASEQIDKQIAAITDWRGELLADNIDKTGIQSLVKEAIKVS